VAKPTKRRIDGDPSGAKKADHEAATSTTSRRYTPPAPNVHRPSPRWVPIAMFGLLGLGFLSIFLNYTEVLPGAPTGWYLVGGLFGILFGIITATQLR
jgi:hypothetical protein